MVNLKSSNSIFFTVKLFYKVKLGKLCVHVHFVFIHAHVMLIKYQKYSVFQGVHVYLVHPPAIRAPNRIRAPPTNDWTMETPATEPYVPDRMEDKKAPKIELKTNATCQWNWKQTIFLYNDLKKKWTYVLW